jgi:hypothetical protein
VAALVKAAQDIKGCLWVMNTYIGAVSNGSLLIRDRDKQHL